MSWELAEEALAIDALYRRVDIKLLAGDFSGVDAEMQAVNIEMLSTTMLLAWLSITSAARDVLGLRATLVNRIRSRLEQTEPARVEALLAGLE